MIRRVGIAASLLWFSLAAFAQTAPPAKPLTDPVDDAAREGFAASLVGKGKKVTDHSVTIRGQRVDYAAIVSGSVIQDADRQPSAIFVAMSYIRKGVADPSKRPVLFAWNGGPSSASFGVHFGVLGPRIRATDAEGHQTNPAKMIDNENSILDRTDLVMMDPVGTGLTVPIGKHKLQDFYSINTDAESVAKFIKAWLDENGRSDSPVYLLGESYGTIRLPVATVYLQGMGITVAGQIYIGPALNGETIWENPAHLEPYFFYLPSYAVIANYHKRTPQHREDVRALWKEAGDFAMNEYLTALFAWPKVTPQQKAAVLDKLYRYTGISKEVWEQHNIRFGTAEFALEILKDQNLVTGISDARQTTPARPAGGRGGRGAGEGQESYIDNYLRTELAVEGAPAYRDNAPGSNEWYWFDHGMRTRAPKVPGYQNFLEDIAVAMKNNPKLRVMQNSGMYDEQCNAFPADWALGRMNIPEELRRNVQIFDYESGHAVFANSRTEFANFTRNLVAFFDADSR
jgi:carboxypeptidase C (cathepsin A)